MRIVGLIVSILITGSFVSGGALAAVKKPVKPAAKGDDKAGTEIQPLESRFVFTGRAVPPAYLKFGTDVQLSLDGIRKGEVKSIATDYAGKDFVFDVILKFDKEDKGFALGIGENGHEANWITNSVAVGWSGRGGSVDLTTATHQRKSLQRSEPEGVHLLRMEKTGDVVNVIAATRAGAEGTPFKVVANGSLEAVSTKAAFLTNKNATLFFAGEATVMSVALTVGGKPVDPGAAPDPKATAAAADLVEKTPLVSVAGAAGIPRWLKASSKVLGDQVGLSGGEIRTADNALFEKDFVCDLLIQFSGDQDRSIPVIGLGEARTDRGRPSNSIHSRVHGPGHKGMFMFSPGGSRDETQIGTLPSGGTHLVRIEKHGPALTFGVCVNYQGKYVPTFARTIPDLSLVASFLTRQNGGVFFDATTGGRLAAARLIVDGKPAEGPPAAVIAAAGPSDSPIDKLPLISLAGQSGIPRWLKADSKALAGKDGIRGGELRTAAHDLGSHDFVFDVLYQFDADDRSIDIIGIGENRKEGGWIRDTVCARVHGPGYDGQVQLLTPAEQSDQLVIGKTGKEAGPHLLRLEKRGQVLTFAIQPEYQGGAFAPMFSRTLPDLPSVAPFLNGINGSLFIEAAGTIKAVRLTIDGKPAAGAEAVAVASNPAGTAKPPPVTGRPATGGGPVVVRGGPTVPVPVTPGPVVSGPDGVEHLFTLTGPKLPSFFKQQRGLKYPGGGLLLADQHVHTLRADYLDKDFTFDVVYTIPTDQWEALIVGIGEYGREGGWILNSVVGKLHGARHDGLVQLVVGKDRDTDIGKAGKPQGPSMFRLQKHGNALTLAVCPLFTGKFEPTMSRTIPDVTSAAPFLTSKNGALFFAGKGKVERVRLVIEGEAIESADLALGVPARVVAGQPVRLQLAKASAGATYGVDKAPQGLAVSTAGELTWTPSPTQTGSHELRIKVTRGGVPLVVPGEVEVVSAEDAKAVKGDLSKIDGLYRLPVEGDKYAFVAGLGGKSMLLLNGDSLRRLDADGITVRETIKLPAKYSLIGEREGYFVAVSDEKQSLDLLDKKTGAVRKSVQMVYRGRWDLALNPVARVSYVTVEKGIEGARDVVLVVDEASGDVMEPPNFVGRWIKIAPDGRTAYTGYKDIYERGSRLLVNPDRIDLIPEYGSIDVLYVWDITGRPRCIHMKSSPGLNGFGIALSPDGRRLSYLSFTGYPLYSHEVPAFDPTNFDKRPVTYMTKENKSNSQDIAYHPYLEIAAAPSEDGAVCFSRESGEVLPGLADLKSPPLGEVKAKHVYFSSDGMNLLIECDDGAETFLRKAKLNLTPAQVQQLQEAKSRRPVAPPPSEPRKPNL